MHRDVDPQRGQSPGSGTTKEFPKKFTLRLRVRGNRVKGEGQKRPGQGSPRLRLTGPEIAILMRTPGLRAF